MLDRIHGARGLTGFRGCRFLGNGGNAVFETDDDTQRLIRVAERVGIPAGVGVGVRAGGRRGVVGSRILPKLIDEGINHRPEGADGGGESGIRGLDHPGDQVQCLGVEIRVGELVAEESADGREPLRAADGSGKRGEGGSELLDVGRMKRDASGRQGVLAVDKGVVFGLEIAADCSGLDGCGAEALGSRAGAEAEVAAAPPET